MVEYFWFLFLHRIGFLINVTTQRLGQQNTLYHWSGNSFSTHTHLLCRKKTRQSERLILLCRPFGAIRNLRLVFVQRWKGWSQWQLFGRRWFTLKTTVGRESVDLGRFAGIGEIFDRVIEIQFPFVLNWSSGPSVAVESGVRVVGVVIRCQCVRIVVIIAGYRIADRLDGPRTVRQSCTIEIVVGFNSIIHQDDGQNAGDELIKNPKRWKSNH